MTLATRCPACGTVFRVVPDQLRVSEGWVRCGRCAEVFNAADRLVDMPAGATTRRTAEADARGQQVDPVQPHDAAPPPAEGEITGADAVPDAPATAEDAQAWPEPDSVMPNDETEPARAEPGREPAASAPADSSTAPSVVAAPAQPPRVRRDDDAPATATPSFVRKADSARRWRHPGVRVALGFVALAGFLGLGVQALVEYRDIAAARWTALQPWLERACAVAGCRVEAPRLIEGLVVDSSGLVRTEGTPLYKLSVVLRNRASLPLAAPALDLSLTDASGRVVSRKVLSLGDLGVAAGAVAAGGTLPVQAVLQIAEGPVTGYTIELFYP